MRHLFLAALFCLAACTQQDWNNRLASPQEQARAIKVANQLRAGQIEQLSEEATPELRQQLPDYLRQIKSMIAPVQGDFGLQTVGSFTLNGSPATKTFIVQSGSGSRWVVVQIVFESAGGTMQIAGLNVTPFESDPLAVNSFQINRRGLVGYLWLTAMLVSVCSCIWAIFLIWRHHWLKRRWLWTLGSLLGVAGFGLNWSTGAWAILVVNVSFLGASVTKAGPYAPWLLSFGLPIVAIIVIVRWYRGERPSDKAGHPISPHL